MFFISAEPGLEGLQWRSGLGCWSRAAGARRWRVRKFWCLVADSSAYLDASREVVQAMSMQAL